MTLSTDRIVLAYAMLVEVVCVVYGLRFALSCLAFWAEGLQNVLDLMLTLFGLIQYPAAIYRGVLRALLTYAVPVVIIANWPAEALVGRLQPGTAAAGAAMAAGALALARWTWRRGLTRYAGASS